MMKNDQVSVFYFKRLEASIKKYQIIHCSCVESRSNLSAPMVSAFVIEFFEGIAT